MRFSFDTKVNHFLVKDKGLSVTPQFWSLSLMSGQFGGMGGLRPITAEVRVAATGLGGATQQI